VLGLSRDGSDDGLGGVLGDDLGLVEHVELLSGVLSSKEKDGALASRVVSHKVSDIEHLSRDNDPAVSLSVVLGDLIPCVLLESRRSRSSSSNRGSNRGSRGSNRGERGRGGRGGAPRGLDGEGVLLRVDDDLGDRVGGVLDGGGDGRGTEVSEDGRSTAKGSRGGGGRGEIREEIASRGSTSKTAKDDAIKKRASSKTVLSVDSTADLTGGVEARDDGTVGVEDLRVGGDRETSHAVVDDGGDDGDVELVVHLKGGVLEELLAKGISVGLGKVVVLGKGLGEDRGRDLHLSGELLSVAEELHEATTDVVLAVPLDLLGSSAVEDETVRSLLVVPHGLGAVVTTAELIAEALSVLAEHETTDTTKGFSSEELDLGIRLIRVNETSGVDLDKVEVDSASADGEGHLDAVSGAVIAVGGGELKEIRTVLLEERVVGKVSAVTTSGDDDGAKLTSELAFVLVLDTDDLVALLDEVGGGGLADDPGAGGLLLGDGLELLHQGVGDGHARESLLATVRTGLRVATETRDEGEVEVEAVLEPVDSRTALEDEDLVELRGLSLLALVGGRDSVLEELLRAVLDAEGDLGLCEGSVDA